MAQVTLFDDEPEFAVARDEAGDVALTIRAERTTIRITVGRGYDSASLLAQSLHHLSADIDDDILDRWEDTPDEDDAYITFDRGRYHVGMEGTRVGDYPSQDVAELELARAMVNGGVFPPAWLINDHGNYLDINEHIRRWHDEGGDGMATIEGVQYQPGDRVWYVEMDWPYSWSATGAPRAWKSTPRGTPSSAPTSPTGTNCTRTRTDGPHARRGRQPPRTVRPSRVAPVPVAHVSP